MPRNGLYADDGRVSEFAAKVKTPGNIAHKYYNDIVSTMRGNKEV